MGMFDEVVTLRVAHEKFKPEHNGLIFQTKCLECELMRYSIFNNVLYIERSCNADGKYTEHDIAVKSDYSGTVNIYTDYEVCGVRYWIEYGLLLKDGVIADVLLAESIVRRTGGHATAKEVATKDLIIASTGASYLDKEQVVFYAEGVTEDKLQEVRELLGLSGCAGVNQTNNVYVVDEFWDLAKK